MGNPIQKNTLFNVFGNCVGNSIPLNLPMNFTKVFKFTPKINVDDLTKVIFFCNYGWIYQLRLKSSNELYAFCANFISYVKIVVHCDLIFGVISQF